ncbi:MAG: hypothetical protein GWN58_01825 [Anaerolineae bacterium]|nr:hypothetical protein [Anaerolineae bacterium]
MNQIVYPMTLDYVPDWGPWEVVREIVTNALDVDPNFSLELNDEGALVVKSQGGDLAIRHLLFGVSEKESESAIGQFGEGLKLALLVLTRMDLTAHIYSGGRHIWNEPHTLEGERVFKLVWKDNPNATGQTVVGIPDWPHGTFEERFIRPGDPRIVHADQFERYILEETSPSIYVRGVWVQGGKSYSAHYTFGYNLVDVKMNRDRGVIDAWKGNQEVGKVWASVTDQELLERFWQAVKDRAGEKDCSLHGMRIGGREPMRRALHAVYGVDAVIATDAAMTREAGYRGANVVDRWNVGGGTLADLAADLMGTDAEHVRQMEGKERVYLPDGKLGSTQHRIIRMLRRLGRRIGLDGNVLAYILPEGVGGEAFRDDIRVSVANLEDAESAIAVWLHEKAHQEHGTEDATAKHADAVAKIAAQVIATYSTR